MQFRELAIQDAWEFTPTVFPDDRGSFHEFYRFEVLSEAVGHPVTLKQGNMSVSSKGVARGIHYALVPPGQAKYIAAPRGAFMDYVIDLRVGSPTFGEWDSVLLDDVNHRAIYLAEGLGHALVALTENATISYLTSETYSPTRELAIDLFDPDIALVLPSGFERPVRSPKDAAAPSLAQALAADALPTWDSTRVLAAARSEETAARGGELPCEG